MVLQSEGEKALFFQCAFFLIRLHFNKGEEIKKIKKRKSFSTSCASLNSFTFCFHRSLMNDLSDYLMHKIFKAYLYYSENIMCPVRARNRQKGQLHRNPGGHWCQDLERY